ncbi:MAG TPA: hypothetical protein VHN80_05830 [Kineosporiaceae bacterium]|nr:hypothetical protein [Kineosporiaceae bacterium]
MPSAIAATVLGACSFGGSTPTVTPSATSIVNSTPQGPASAAAASPGPASDGAAAATPASEPAGAVLGRAATSAQDVPLSVALTQVRVLGQLLQVSFTVTNTTPPPDRGSGWQVNTFFSNGINDALAPDFGGPDSTSIDGVYLLDPKNAKRYLVARDPNGLCACTGNTGAIFVKAGTPVTFTSTFKAPPPDVTTMTVVIPKLPPFENIAVQR